MKYPIGIQSFDRIVNDGYVYVDKIWLQLRNLKKILYTMKKTLLLILCLIGMAVSAKAQNPLEGLNCTIESAERLIRMMDAASHGMMPTEQEWIDLFQTEGYRTSIGRRKDAQEWKDGIKEAFLINFDTSRRAELDSIINLPFSMENISRYRFINNFYSVKNRLPELMDFLQKMDMKKILLKSDKMVRKYLPKRADLSKAEFGNIHFVLWDGEGRAWTKGVFIDLNLALDGGEKELIRTLAHEFHHKYMGAIISSMYKKDSQDHALVAIFKNQQEGTADMISRPVMPVEKMGVYSKEIVKMYNDDYFSSPQVLQELDSITCQYLAGKITQKEYRKARGCAHFEGHTTGDYMVFLIRDQLGAKVAVECFCDFPKFVKLYNEAARKANSYVFSDTFVNHIENECRKMNQE